MKIGSLLSLVGLVPSSLRGYANLLMTNVRFPISVYVPINVNVPIAVYVSVDAGVFTAVIPVVITISVIVPAIS